MVTDVVVLTLVVATLKPDAVVPEPTVTLAGTLASAGLLLDRARSRRRGVRHRRAITKPDVSEPPATLDGLTVTLCRVGPAAAPVVTVSVRRARDPVVRRGDRHRRGGARPGTS